MLRVLLHIVKKEFIQAFRDRKMLMLILVAPVLQVILFGFAVNLDLSSQPIIIADLDRSEESRELVRLLVNNDGFSVLAVTDSHEDAENAVLLGKAVAGLLIPKGYAEDHERSRAELLWVMDGSDSNTALRAGQEATQILNNHTLTGMRELIQTKLSAQGFSPDRLIPKISIATRPWFNPRIRSAVFTVPGVLGLVLMVITMMLTSLGLTREKEIGTLEQIMVTPIRSWQLILGKVLPFAILGLIDILLIISAAALVFKIPVMGPVSALIGASTIFLMTTLGLGLFVSTISATQQQAMMNSFFIMLPSLLLSGFMFPIENMPKAVQWLTVVNPLRYFIEIVRGIMVKGASPVELWESGLKLLVIGLTIFIAASLRFRKRLS